MIMWPQPTMPRRGKAAALATIGALAALVAITAGQEQPARATFGGANGFIAFDSNRDDDFEIFRMKPDGDRQRQLTNNDDLDYGAAASPDGRRIAFFSERDGDGEVYVMRADGSRERNVSNEPSSSENEPAFTPNGKRIVFQSDRDGFPDIYSMRLDGSGVRQLTDGPTSSAVPTVADNGRIAFVRDGDIWMMRADGSRERNVTESPVDENYPNLAASGKRLAFECRQDGDDLEVCTIRADGSRRRQLTRNDDADFAPVFSPDGKRIAWDSLGDIRVMRTDGTGKHRLTLSPSGDEYADWAPKP
jgi:Tol biopolymer transport system component